VTWAGDAEPTVLTSESQIADALETDDLSLQRTDVIINATTDLARRRTLKRLTSPTGVSCPRHAVLSR
jgi:hypothetical protein